ncbi:MAG: hypothetical protein LBV75_01425 [Paludibacter sp.]|jgi:hypothetical protein|nr:hypothetical protein [Paludibacter sp.]
MNLEIPDGTNIEVVKQREQIIKDFYASWVSTNPEKRIYNADLKEFIYVRFLSIQETAEQAAKRYISTLAVTYLTEILELALVKEISKPKPNTANQSRFKDMILMEYEKDGVGVIKLTVGVLRGSGNNIQYCITAIEKNNDKKARENAQ